MINLKDGGLADISPFRGEPCSEAFSCAIKKMMQFILEKADSTRTYSIIDSLPDEILDLLAIELRTMYYDENLDIETKRNIIKNTLAWYAKAGTPAAVEELIQVIFGNGKTIEWFDFTEPPYTPGTFDIVTNASLTANSMESMLGIIDRVKNSRSHLRRIVVERELHSGVTIALWAVSTEESVALNFVEGDGEINSESYIAGQGLVSVSSDSSNQISDNTDCQSDNQVAVYANISEDNCVLNAENQTSEAVATMINAGKGQLSSSNTYIK